MSVTLARRRGPPGAPEHARPADGGDRGARRRRHDLRRQDRHAHRRHPEAGRGRGRRPGAGPPPPSARSATSPPRPASATGRWRRSPSATRPTPSGRRAEVPFSSQWKWSGLTLNGSSYVIGAPDVLAARRRARAARGARSGRSTEHTGAGRRVIAFGEARGGLPSDPAREPPPPLEPRALVVLEETLRPDAAETIAYMRDQQVDLKLISGDARETVTAVAHAVGVERGRPGDRGLGAAHRQGRARRRRRCATPSSAGSRRSRRRRWSARSPSAAASPR